MMLPSLLASQLILAAMTSAAIFFDPIAVKHSCVNGDGSTLTPGVPVHLADIDTSYQEQTILLKPIAPASVGNDDNVTSMCVLHRWTLPLEDKLDKRGYYYPLGRSAPRIPGDARGENSTSDPTLGDWTRPPGRASGKIEYACGEASNTGSNFVQGEYLCEVTLPATSAPQAVDASILDHHDLPYFLTYYERNTSVRDEMSRFLQKNTFGPTSAELDALEASFLELKGGGGLDHDGAMAKVQLDWVVSQMDPSTFASGEFSSLRAYWRRRLNPRKEETYRIGESGPHPCEKHSRWRKFAFTNFDVQNSKILRWGTQEYGQTVQTQVGHRVSVETVALSFASDNVTSSSRALQVSASPTLAPASSIQASASPTLKPASSIQVSAIPTLAPASSMPVSFALFRPSPVLLNLIRPIA